MNKKTYHQCLTRLLVGLLAFAAVTILSMQSGFAVQETIVQQSTLTIGSKAPSLDIEHWISNGNGEFEKVTKFEEGKIYVIEFWATWCQPCIAAMPHIRELQEEYKDQGLQIISVSDESLPRVEGFLGRQVRGKDGMTYRDLTSAYCLVTDPDASTQNDYMTAANQNTIPIAFIVGKSGQIEWFGHPMAIDDPINKIVNDQWDREAYVVEMETEKRLQKAMSKVVPLVKQGMPQEALSVLNELIKESEDENLKERLLSLRPRLRIEIGGEQAIEPFRSESEKHANDPVVLHLMALQIVEQSDAGNEIPSELLALALKASAVAEEAARETGRPQIIGRVLDTRAHLLYINGELDSAIEAQAEAADTTGNKSYRLFLDKMLEEKTGAGDVDADKEAA